MNLEQSLKEVQKDIKNLKLIVFEPSKNEARFLLDYLCWEENDARKNFDAIYAKELELLHEWLEIYCEEHNCSKEDALLSIVEG